MLVFLQSSLVDVYTIRKSYANLHTLDDLDRSGLMIYVRHKGLIVDVFGEEQPGTPIGGQILTFNRSCSLRMVAFSRKPSKEVGGYGK